VNWDWKTLCAMYSVKEIFLSLQGEGINSGKTAVFCRFSGCNLWSGRERDRATAVCHFCDTDFIGTDGAGGGKYADAMLLAHTLFQYWPDQNQSPFVVLSGGEPLLQLDLPLLNALHQYGFIVAVESNGTLVAPSGIDWLCVSPKAGSALVQTCGDELKLVYPQTGLDPATLTHLDFSHFILQPLDGAQHAYHTRLALDYCLAHPRWRLGMQTHKLLGIA
jgi:7-carboxy-7-deazaguanine synthase